MRRHLTLASDPDPNLDPNLDPYPDPNPDPNLDANPDPNPDPNLNPNPNPDLNLNPSQVMRPPEGQIASWQDLYLVTELCDSDLHQVSP